MCENIDWNVGRLLKSINSAWEDTIVLFFHDNGPNGVRWNGGMKGARDRRMKAACGRRWSSAGLRAFRRALCKTHRLGHGFAPHAGGLRGHSGG